jgi:glycosyltransferase involved in cell wall biosynthesis
MKKISVLSPSLRGGGIERQLLLLSDELRRRGLDVDLVVVNTANTAYAPDSSAQLVDLKAARISRGLVPLVNYLRRTRPQVMISAETPVNVLALLARMITGIPKRLVVSERIHLSSAVAHATRPQDYWRPLLIRCLYPFADQVVAVSKGVAADLTASAGLKAAAIRPLYNMFDISHILAESQCDPALPWLGRDASPVIITAGRLSPQKDQHTLIRAFAILRSRRPCRLLILGTGPEQPGLQELARELHVEDDILMAGFVANPFACVARAAVFVLSSAWEGLPGVLIEALACGTPVVSTDCPSGPSEILENGKYGALTPVGDAQALAEAISSMLEHPLPGEVLRRRAMDFSIERIIPQYLEVLQVESSAATGR